MKSVEWGAGRTRAEPQSRREMESVECRVGKTHAEARRRGECFAIASLKGKVALPVFLYTLQA